jgi:hypothetical protein
VPLKGITEGEKSPSGEFFLELRPFSTKHHSCRRGGRICQRASVRPRAVRTERQETVRLDCFSEGPACRVGANLDLLVLLRQSLPRSFRGQKNKKKLRTSVSSSIFPRYSCAEVKNRIASSPGLKPGAIISVVPTALTSMTSEKK